MKKRVAIYPSVMCSKPWELKDYIAEFEKAGVDGIHFDVMDGHFVANITLGTGDYEAIRNINPVEPNKKDLERVFLSANNRIPKLSF
ncbi:MAG TPA: hypothetical protein PLI19_05850, partial [Erysipelotrichaceae bacterium]|nr:hypothetical protein [Erysipelotrichaceae bacterium]